MFLFLCFLENDALAELFVVFLELKLAFYLSLVLASVIDLAGGLVPKDYELYL